MMNLRQYRRVPVLFLKHSADRRWFEELIRKLWHNILPVDVQEHIQAEIELRGLTEDRVQLLRDMSGFKVFDIVKESLEQYMNDPVARMQYTHAMFNFHLDLAIEDCQRSYVLAMDEILADYRHIRIMSWREMSNELLFKHETSNFADQPPDIPAEFLRLAWDTAHLTEAELQAKVKQYVDWLLEQLDKFERTSEEQLNEAKDIVEQLRALEEEQLRALQEEQLRALEGEQVRAIEESILRFEEQLRALEESPPEVGDVPTVSVNGELVEVNEEGSDLFNEVSPQEGETGQGETEIYHSEEGYMRHPSIVIPPLAHLSVEQLKKLELVSSLFPNIPPETVMEQLMLQSSEQIIHPGLAAIRDSYPGPIPQSLEDIVQGLTDDQTSFEDFQTLLEDRRTHLEEDPLFRQFLTTMRETEPEEHLNQATERLRNDNPELMNEVEEYRAFIDELDGVFNPSQSEAATDATGTTGALETPDVEVIGAQVSNIMQTTAMRMFGHVQSEAATEAAGTTEAVETSDVEVIGAQVSSMVQTAGAFAGTSILARIIWRNLKHLQDFYRDVGKLRNDVEDLNQKYEAGEITQEVYKLGVDEAVRGLEELFPERVSTSLDAIYPNWASKVLGIKEENRPGEDNARSANPEPSGAELAQAFTTHIADGDLYSAAAVDYIASSMTEADLNSFLTEIRNPEALQGINSEEETQNEVSEQHASSESGEEAQWFVQWDDSQLDNLPVPPMKELPHRLDEIDSQLSDSQLNDLEEIRDASPKDAAWQGKVSDWFSTLDEGLQINIQDAYKIGNPPTATQVHGGSNISGQTGVQISDTEAGRQQGRATHRQIEGSIDPVESTKPQDATLPAKLAAQTAVHSDSSESKDGPENNSDAQLPAKLAAQTAVHSDLSETKGSSEGGLAKLHTSRKPSDSLPIDDGSDSSDSA